jgi:hypothetical protein
MFLSEPKKSFRRAQQSFGGIKQKAGKTTDQSTVEADIWQVLSDIVLDQIDQLPCVPSLHLIGDETRYAGLVLGCRTCLSLDCQACRCSVSRMVQRVTQSLSANHSRRAHDDKTSFARRPSVHHNGFICPLQGALQAFPRLGCPHFYCFPWIRIYCV